MEEQKIVYIVTHGKSNPEKAIIPFVLANGAIAMDVKPVIILQSEGVLIGKKGYAKEIKHEGFDSLDKLLEQYLSFGNKLYLCGPCVKARGIENDLIDGAVIVGAAKVTEEILSAKAVLTY